LGHDGGNSDDIMHRLITLRAAIRSNRVEYGKTYIKHSNIEKYMESVFIICKLCVFDSPLWRDVLDETFFANTLAQVLTIHNLDH
jgi:hypothetical protein